MRIVALLAIVILTSCNKKYKYIEVVENYKIDSGKELKYRAAKMIDADTDSAAYCKAYQNLCISKRSTIEVAKMYGTVSMIPVNFILYNDRNEDIKNQVLFANKVEREKDIRDMVSSLELPK